MESKFTDYILIKFDDIPSWLLDKINREGIKWETYQREEA